jgi:voltage-gated potassium channel Kch
MTTRPRFTGTVGRDHASASWTVNRPRGAAGGITMTADDVAVAPLDRQAAAMNESPIYELFIGLMTIISLIIVFFHVIVRVPQVDAILTSTDTLVCFLFLFDFARSYRRAPDKRVYMFGEQPGRTLPRGLFDLLGSIPGAEIFRVLRIFRVARLTRLVRASGSRGLAAEFFKRRAESAVYVIILMSFVVLLVGSILIAYVEPPAQGSNIKTAGDAFWWAFVTITTVGYGDRFPVTEAGRIVGMFTMAVGIGIFGVLTSYLSTVFLARPEDDPAATTPTPKPAPDPVQAELAALRAEMAGLRRVLEVQESG